MAACIAGAITRFARRSGDRQTVNVIANACPTVA